MPGHIASNSFTLVLVLKEVAGLVQYLSNAPPHKQVSLQT